MLMEIQLKSIHLQSPLKTAQLNLVLLMVLLLHLQPLGTLAFSSTIIHQVRRSLVSFGNMLTEDLSLVLKLVMVVEPIITVHKSQSLTMQQLKLVLCGSMIVQVLLKSSIVLEPQEHLKISQLTQELSEINFTI